MFMTPGSKVLTPHELAHKRAKDLGVLSNIISAQKNPGKRKHRVLHFPGSLQRLSGVEPPHMPPEGIALSTELQTHSGL